MLLTTVRTTVLMTVLRPAGDSRAWSAVNAGGCHSWLPVEAVEAVEAAAS